MYNGTKMKAHGKCILNVRNPKTKQKHRAEFVVVNEPANFILGAQLVQRMGLVEVRYDRIHAIEDPKPLQKEPLTETSEYRKYNTVFETENTVKNYYEKSREVWQRPLGSIT